MMSQDKPLSPDVSGAYQGDEFDLVQLCLILLKRKYLIGSVFLLCLFAGMAFAFLTPVKYTYSTTIDIGSTLAHNGAGMVSRVIESPGVVLASLVSRGIEPPGLVLAKIKESYIPLAVNEMMRLEGKVFFNVKVKNPKLSNLIILSSQGTAKMAESYQKLHNLVTKPLMEDHLRIINVPRREFQLSSQQESIKLKTLQDPRMLAIEEKDWLIQIETAKIYLTGIDDKEKLLLSQEMRLAETQVLLRKRISKAEENIAQAQKAINKVDNEAEAMTLLMDTTQVEQKEKRLYDLQERLTIKIEDEKEILLSDIDEVRRGRALQKEKIAGLQLQLVKLKAQRETDQDYQKSIVLSIDNKLANLRETRTLGVAVRSVESSNTSKTVVWAMSGVFGLIVGVFLAFFVEFVTVVRQRMAV